MFPRKFVQKNFFLVLCALFQAAENMQRYNRGTLLYNTKLDSCFGEKMPEVPKVDGLNLDGVRPILVANRHLSITDFSAN